MKKLILFITTLLSLNSFGQVNLNSGLHICFPFNGNATDYSGLSNNGIVTGAVATTDRFANPTGALSFSGNNNFVRLNNVLPNMSRFSISTWVFNTKSNGLGTIFCDADLVSYNDVWMTMQNSGFDIIANKPGGSLMGYGAVTGQNLNNAWHHIVWVCDSSSQKIYIDTVLIASLNVSGTNIGYHNIQASIGQMGDAPGNNGYYNFFQGKMDDFRLYSRAITPTEVYALYHTVGCACAEPDAAAAVDGVTLVCAGNAYSYSITPVAGASYSWTLPNGWTGGSATNTISGVPGSAGTISVTITSACSLTSVYTLSVNLDDCAGPTAIKTNLKNSQSILLVYPNPNNGNFIIETEEKGILKVTNLLGEILLEGAVISGKNKIDLTEYPDGIYFIKVKQNDHSKSIKVIKH